MLNINFSFYRDHDTVPIEEVAKSLGIEVKRGKILCPCHDDHNPSCIITTKGKYANKFKCFSCNESGGPIELVMATKYGITPSEYKANKSEYTKQFYESIQYLDGLYPGGMTQIKNAKTFIPQIPAKVFKDIGFPVYFFDKGLSVNKFLNAYYQKSEAPEDIWSIVRKSMPNSLFYNPKNLMDIFEISEKIDLFEEAVTKHLEQEEQAQMDFQKKYPDMPPEGRRYMVQVFSQKYEDYQAIIQQLDEFKDTYIEPFMDGIARIMQEDLSDEELQNATIDDLENMTDLERE